jgi:hypothetical protein
LGVADDGSIELEVASDDDESFMVDRRDEDDVLLDESDEDDDLLPMTTPARRKSLHGHRVQRPTVPPQRNLPFETADDLMHRQDDDRGRSNRSLVRYTDLQGCVTINCDCN